MADKSLKDVAVKIKWKDYVQVKDRIQYLSDNYEGRYDLESDYQYFPESKLRVVKATLTVWDEKHETCCKYDGLAQEVESDDYKMVNFSSALENAQTSARGRCCAGFGLWIQCDWGIASANEMQKALNRSKSGETKKDDGKSWYEKTLGNVKFMQDCMDELDFMKKVKAGVTKIGETMTSEQEKNLRIAYQNAKAMESFDPSILSN